MIEYKYGDFSEEQIGKYKDKLHKELFWLLLYKDPNTCGDYEEVDFDGYFANFMKRLNAFNELLFYPQEIVSIAVLCQAAYNETLKDEFNFKAYRK